MLKESLSLSILTTTQKEDIDNWFDQQLLQWQSATQDSQSIESAALADQEARWLAETEYYQDRYLYADRL